MQKHEVFQDMIELRDSYDELKDKMDKEVRANLDA